MSDLVLVTGGAGYIGSALLSELRDRGYRLRVLDDFSGSDPGNLVGAPRFDFVRGDIRDPTAVDRAMDGVDAVIHLAAITGAADSHAIADEVHDVNLGGTEAVLAAAESAGVDRVVLASSCNVYGHTNAEYLVEEDDPAPRNPYAASKLAAEEACAASPLETVAIRLATNFGWSPGIRFNLVVNAFVFRALYGEPLTVYGDGTNWRPFVHVSDSARAFAEALGWEPGIYNVGQSNQRLANVAAAVSRAVTAPVVTDYLGDADPGPSYHVDFAKATAQGFVPKVSFQAGIDDLVERFKTGQLRSVIHG